MEVSTLPDSRAAHELVARHARRTPLLTSRLLSEETGFDVRLKAELLQRTGSYKLRGPLVKLARLSEAERARGVVCSSAGNHAQGVALAAALLGGLAVLALLAFLLFGSADKVTVPPVVGQTLEQARQRVDRAGLDVEGLGMVFLEAAACGRPVVAGTSGGAPEAVQEGVTGHVVDPRSPTAVARTLADLAYMAQLRGARTVVVGIAPEVAMTLVRLGVRIPLTQTALDLEEGLEWLST